MSPIEAGLPCLKGIVHLKKASLNIYSQLAYAEKNKLHTAPLVSCGGNDFISNMLLD